MPTITSSTAPNGLPVHRVALEGTRATTILVAFDAGARTERPEENGMAHFLEHLVFKGGESYDDYRKVNETAERMGGTLNAYTSHDLVAFHITVRAESADAGHRPAHRLRRAPADRRRRARPRARRRDPGDPALQGPAGGGGRGADRPRGLRRPPARAHRPRPRGAPAHASRARRSSPSASAAGPAQRGGAFVVGNVDHVPSERRGRRALRALPDAARRPTATSPSAPSTRSASSRSATPTSRTCG